MSEEIEPEEQRGLLLRQKYGELYDQLSEILFLHDPVGLAALGAPEDEYSVEVKEFLPHLQEIKSLPALSQLLYDVFVRMFSKEMISQQKIMFDPIAEDIWEAYKHWEGK
jgi:hypothetical protein